MLRYTRIHTKTDDKGFYLHWSCTAGEQYTDFMEIDHVEDKPGVSEIIEELLENIGSRKKINKTRASRHEKNSPLLAYFGLLFSPSTKFKQRSGH